MPKVYKRKKEKTRGEEDVNKALADIRNGCSIRTAAKTHKMSELVCIKDLEYCVKCVYRIT